MDTPRTISIKKTADGFGFNVRGQVVEGGQVKAIHGKLYAPLQYVSAITQDSLAEKAGLRLGDKILQMYVDPMFKKLHFVFVLFCLEEMELVLKVHHIIKS